MKIETRFMLSATGATLALSSTGALDGRSFAQSMLAVGGSVLAVAAFFEPWGNEGPSPEGKGRLASEPLSKDT